MISTPSAAPSAKPPKPATTSPVMDELDFVKELIARLPTRRDQAFVPLRIMFGSAVSQRFVRDRLDRAILVALPLNSAPSHRPCTHRT
jgi:hypothetical protein